MNMISKGVLTAMTLVLDFAAGSALDQLWDADLFSETVEAQTVIPTVIATAATVAAEQQPGGGVCKPLEHAVMVMEIDRSSTDGKGAPRHVCIRALSGEPEIAAQLQSDLSTRPGRTEMTH